VGGGLIVISNGWAMLKSKEEVDRGRDVQKKVNLKNISSQRLLSADLAAYCRSRLDFHGHHTRGK